MAFAMPLSMLVLTWLSPDNSLLRTGIKCVVPLAKPRLPTAGFANRLGGEELEPHSKEGYFRLTLGVVVMPPRRM